MDNLKSQLLAVSRGLGSSPERQLLRNLPLKLDESAAIGDPIETFANASHQRCGLIEPDCMRLLGDILRFMSIDRNLFRMEFHILRLDVETQ